MLLRLNKDGSVSASEYVHSEHHTRNLMVFKRSFPAAVRQFLDSAKEDGAEYAYYFANTGKWICHDLYAGKEITLEQDHSENTTHQPATKRRDTRK